MMIASSPGEDEEGEEGGPQVRRMEREGFCRVDGDERGGYCERGSSALASVWEVGSGCCCCCCCCC
jgi:hypothetical protein